MHLYLIRGLPGAGKSTLAQELAVGCNGFRAEADFYFYNEYGEYNWYPEGANAAHKQCQAKAHWCMQNGHSVIVSNTFTTEKELKPYLELAKEFGYRITCIIVENRHGNVSIHGVPEETMTKMRDRFSVKL